MSTTELLPLRGSPMPRLHARASNDETEAAMMMGGSKTHSKLFLKPSSTLSAPAPLKPTMGTADTLSLPNPALARRPVKLASMVSDLDTATPSAAPLKTLSSTMAARPLRLASAVTKPLDAAGGDKPVSAASSMPASSFLKPLGGAKDVLLAPPTPSPLPLADKSAHTGLGALSKLPARLGHCSLSSPGESDDTYARSKPSGMRAKLQNLVLSDDFGDTSDAALEPPQPVAQAATTARGQGGVVPLPPLGKPPAKGPSPRTSRIMRHSISVETLRGTAGAELTRSLCKMASV